MADYEVYKTIVTCEIGFSIQSPDQSWEKSSVSVATESGPGYPTKDTMSWLLKSQMADAVDGCNEQIETIARKVIESTKRSS